MSKSCLLMMISVQIYVNIHENERQIFIQTFLFNSFCLFKIMGVNKSFYVLANLLDDNNHQEKNLQINRGLKIRIWRKNWGSKCNNEQKLKHSLQLKCVDIIIQKETVIIYGDSSDFKFDIHLHPITHAILFLVFYHT